MIKLLLFAGLTAAAGYFVINNTPSLKEKVFEAVNPAYKERRLLNDLKINLTNINDSLGQNTGNTSPDLKSAKETLNQSQELVDNILKINNANSGILSQAVTKIADNIFSSTPTPAPTPCSQ